MLACACVEFDRLPMPWSLYLLLSPDDLLQHAGDTLASETGIHFQSQALPRVGIDHAQHPDRSSRGQ